MNKPVLLLVDDDRAVLDALEVELTPAFAELCRIEAFDDARTVLEVLPRWTEERRSIAVAIVDQKMPGMTGVELLAALRASVEAAGSTAFTPARNARAILLTGYAGLDSAMAAKNAGGVDRYLEKPWHSSDLHQQVRQLVRAHHVQGGTADYMMFRELRGVAEFREQFRLRYEVYARSPDLVYLLAQNHSRLAADAYDLVSHFYGLFHVQPESSEQVGGVRVIGEESPGAAAVVAIAQEDPVLRAHVAKPREFHIELPMKWPDPSAIVEFIDARIAEGERVAEVGRLVLAATERGAGLGRSPGALAILEGVAGFTGFVRGVENTVLNCSARHSAAYASFGFQKVPGTAATFNPSSDDNIIALWARPEWVPQPARARVLAIAAAAQRTGQACRCRAFPACTGGPYETGDFTNVDVSCPRLVMERTKPPVKSATVSEPTGAEFEG